MTSNNQGKFRYERNLPVTHNWRVQQSKSWQEGSTTRSSLETPSDKTKVSFSIDDSQSIQRSHSVSSSNRPLSGSSSHDSGIVSSSPVSNSAESSPWQTVTRSKPTTHSVSPSDNSHQRNRGRGRGSLNQHRQLTNRPKR